MVSVSAIVCTCNRPVLLAAALDSLLHQTLDSSAFEIIVVDNGSERGAVHEDLAAGPGAPRLVREPVRGLARARNTGWRHARGDLIAYLDDDALAAPEWLERILLVFESTEPRPHALGGRVVPLWGGPRPDWLADNLLTYLSVLDHSPTARFLETHEHIVGANMAFPREVLDEVGGFPTWLGRKGDHLLSGEEVVVADRVRAAGGLVRYDPAIVVRHHVPAGRLTRRWLVRRAYWQGFGEALVLRHDAAPSLAERLRRALDLLRHIAVSRRQVASLIFPDATAAGFEIRMQSCSRIGYIRGLLAPARW